MSFRIFLNLLLLHAAEVVASEVGGEVHVVAEVVAEPREELHLAEAME